MCLVRTTLKAETQSISIYDMHETRSDGNGKQIKLSYFGSIALQYAIYRIMLHNNLFNVKSKRLMNSLIEGIREAIK